MPRGPDYQKDRSERQQQRILAVLAECPMTAVQLGERIYLARYNVQKHLAALMDKSNRRVRVKSFVITGGRPQLIYALGKGADANIERFQEKRVLDVLRDMTVPQTAAQIAALIDMSYPSARNYVRRLREQHKIYVGGWMWADRKPTAMYLFGKGDDVPQPKCKPKVKAVRAAPRLWLAALPGAQAVAQREAA